MCDDHTEADNELNLRNARLSRRELGLGASATVATLLAGCRAPASVAEPAAVTDAARATGSTRAPDPSGAAIAGRMVTVDTPDGTAEAFFAAADGSKHPGVLIWPDIAGLRPAFTAVATRLAEAGFAVLAVNPYYRTAKMPVLDSFEQWRTEAGKAKINAARGALTNDAIMRDGAAFVAWLDRQAQVDTARKIGTTGYCMGGAFTVRTAAAAPERVSVIGSFHGGGLVTEEADSPHKLLARTKVAALICIAANDDERAPETKVTLRQAAEAARLTAEIEVYPAQHGWCVADSPVYDHTQAERAWTRLLEALATNL